MKRLMFAALGAAALFAAPAQAGVYADDLSRCLIKSANPADQKVLVQWTFASLAQHPMAKAYSSVTPAQVTALSRQAAALMDRLMTKDCRAQTLAALKNEGADAIETGLTLLGQVAFRALTEDQSVVAAMGQFGNYADPKLWDTLRKDAGLPVAGTPVPKATP